MGAFADSLFTLLLGWVRGVVSAIMTLVSSGGESGILPFIGKHWLVIVLGILAVGLFGDWFTYMVRWQPYRVWGTNLRRVARALHIRREETADEPEEEPQPAQAYAPQDDGMADTMLYQRGGTAQEENIDFAPDDQADFELPPLTQEDEEQAYAAADGVEDAQLGDYPGMRYDMSAYMRPEEPEAGEEITEIEASEPIESIESIKEMPAQAVYQEPASEQTDEVEAAYADFAPETFPDFDPAYAYEQETEPQWMQPEEETGDAPQDVEFAQELDPLADYVPQPEANDAQDADAPSRRRRRRRSGTPLDAQDTQLYTTVRRGGENG